MLDEASFASEYHALSALFDAADKKDGDGGAAPSTSAQDTPAAVGPQDLLPVVVPAATGRVVNDIWEATAVPDAADMPDVDDGRQRPRYSFVYKQAVGTADTYLGMSGKDPSSTCCEQLVVRVELPAAKTIKDVELDVHATYLRLSSSQYKLNLHLPHKVDDQRGKATWDAKQQVLSITLPIIRSEDLLLVQIFRFFTTTR